MQQTYIKIHDLAQLDGKGGPVKSVQETKVWPC